MLYEVITYMIQHYGAEQKADKLMEMPKLYKTPIVRNGKQATVGYQPDVWKGWEWEPLDAA